jgi:16S rRNA G1207 methylase RsmC
MADSKLMTENDNAWSGQVAHYKEDIFFEATLQNNQISFRTTYGLFSPKAIDAGTELLIETLDIDSDYDCLDLGCGYGPIGIALSRLAPEGRTLLIDKDYVAIEYSQHNLELNGVTNADVLLSNGLSKVPDDQLFDVVAMNLPAKIGNELTTVLFADSFLHLKPGGTLYVVSLAGMRGFIKRSLGGIFGNVDKLKQGKQHAVHVSYRETQTK